MPRIDTVLGKYLRMYASCNYSQSSLEHVRYNVEEFVAVNRLKKTESIMPRHVDAYQGYLAKRSIKTNTIRGKLFVLSKFLSHIRALNLILFDPRMYITIPGKERTLPRNVLTQEEMRTLLGLPVLDIVKNLPMRTVIEIFYGTGIRMSELIKLDITDLNMRERVLTVREGKFKKDRVIPVPKTTVRYVAEYMRTFRKKTRTRQKALIVNWAGKRMPKATLQCAMAKLSKVVRAEYGFPKRISCHGFRHSIATHLLERGVDLRYIQAFLGHSSLESTRIYTHIVPTQLKKEIFRTHPREKMTLKF